MLFLLANERFSELFLVILFDFFYWQLSVNDLPNRNKQHFRLNKIVEKFFLHIRSF